jgi:hypothetical protein
MPESWELEKEGGAVSKKIQDPNRRQFLLGVAAQALPKPDPIILKPRSEGITTVSSELIQYREAQLSRVLSVACGEPLEFKFDLSEAENNA